VETGACRQTGTKSSSSSPSEIENELIEDGDDDEDDHKFAQASPARPSGSLALMPAPLGAAHIFFEVHRGAPIKTSMLPTLLEHGGPMMYLLLLLSAVAMTVFVERLLHYHRAQINSTEFLSGVRNVLKRENLVEAISICDATPGPVPRLVKTAILNYEKGREHVREALEEAGLLEVPRLENKLNMLATIAQIAPLLGLLGTVLGFMSVFSGITAEGFNAPVSRLAGGVWEALVCTAFGLAVAIPSYASYNYLVSRVNSIVLDMEKASNEILNIVTSLPPPPKAV
jgi:biopolymer transport protein ExbB